MLFKLHVDFVTIVYTHCHMNQLRMLMTFITTMCDHLPILEQSCMAVICINRLCAIDTDKHEYIKVNRRFITAVGF